MQLKQILLALSFLSKLFKRKKSRRQTRRDPAEFESFKSSKVEQSFGLGA